jgi:hypothetical protein
MKRTSFSVYALLVCIWVISGAKAWGQVSPLTWNSFVYASSLYDSSQPFSSDVVSRFTPADAITVTRIEVQAGVGAQRYNNSTFPGQYIACTNPVAFKITDGRKSFTLPLPSATTLGSWPANNPSSADSGPLNLNFSAHAKIVMAEVQGDPPALNVSGCTASYINITVQYKIKTSGAAQ